MNMNATMLAQAVTYLVFIWLTVKFLWPYILAAIDERRTTITEGLAAADKGSKSLEEAQVKISGMVEEARGQARQILDQAQTRANGIVDEARVGATHERDRILQSAQADIDQQINRARDELRGQVAAITVAGAEKILAREIDPRAHQDLLDKLVTQL
jgi:F-type H+-transporting ATPase subunit b